MERSTKFDSTVRNITPGLYMIRIYGGWPDESELTEYLQKVLETEKKYVIYNRVESPELGPGSRFVVAKCEEE